MTRITAFLITLLLVFSSSGLHSQELNCMINVSTPKLSGTDKKIFQTLQTAVYEFVNNRKWSTFNFKQEERIECTMLITINERLSADDFRGTMNVVIRRPVLNAAYNSVLLNTVDRNIQFRYVEYQPLDYADGTFTSNLTSILAFYSYTIIGFYMDSFSPSGGTPYFEKAQEVVNAAQNSSEPGWKAYESDKNRYWIINNYMNSANSELRDFSYRFHRLGLDQMYEKVDQGRNIVSESLEVLQKLYNAKPNLYALQLIFDAKRDEFVNIYADQRVAPMEKTNITNLLKEIDPANSSKYQAILESK
ncbi:MAG: DUF4835 family protein [Bacteroidales bacterium]|nr:DUF4835 family protein [Bacteroidales bacterium]